VRPELVSYLLCPSCGSSLESRPTASDGEHVMHGTLACTACSGVYSVERGVPRMNARMEGLERVARTFSYEWKAHHEGRLEHDDTLWGLTADEDWSYFLEATRLRENDLAGAVVLDAGCGSGRLTGQIAEHGAKTVVGVDMIEAVDGAFEATRHLPNVHIVQGNIFELPLRRKAFDLVWSNGVIHHTPDARGAHAALAEMVAPGGLLYVWVYAKRFNPFRFTKDVLDLLHVTSLPAPALLRISRIFAYISVGLHRLYKLVRRVPPFRPRTRWADRTLRRRTVHELSLTWFDALSPAYDSRHTEAEVIGWFERLGFTSIGTVEEPKVGVRGTAPAASLH
jgi:SAM-dependent methyltransferase/uncharacterized protein YbaR (Trm112 family)